MVGFIDHCKYANLIPVALKVSNISALVGFKAKPPDLAENNSKNGGLFTMHTKFTNKALGSVTVMGTF